MKNSWPMMDKNINFYKANREKLRTQYMGKFIAIRNKKVLGAYTSHAEAYEKVTVNNAIGTFIIEHIKPPATK